MTEHRNRHAEPGGCLYLASVRARNYGDPHRGPIPCDIPDWCRGGDDPLPEDGEDG